ncbi:MAG: hypothetical protein JO182_00010 [Acidobacteriaceae bacterium]|nr:hypothetical protein [Acidobacteriaceae bacterium]
MKKWKLALMLAALLEAAPFANAAWHSPIHVGVSCQEGFQNNWLPANYGDAWSRCSNFINTIKGSDYVDFYYNLAGAWVRFRSGQWQESCNSCGGADSVDFYFMTTHGGVLSSYVADYAMWDQNSEVWTSTMRFGEAGQQLKVFATFVCDTFKTSDGHFVDRWWRAFSGGLKMGLGAHDLLYTGNTQMGGEFASRLQDGEPIGRAWNEAVWYADNNNHPSVANTGVNSNDCWNRMGANMATIQAIPPLRDNQIGYYCWSGWNGY